MGLWVVGWDGTSVPRLRGFCSPNLPRLVSYYLSEQGTVRSLAVSQAKPGKLARDRSQTQCHGSCVAWLGIWHHASYHCASECKLCSVPLVHYDFGGASGIRSTTWSIQRELYSINSTREHDHQHHCIQDTEFSLPVQRVCKRLRAHPITNTMYRVRQSVAMYIASPVFRPASLVLTLTLLLQHCTAPLFPSTIVLTSVFPELLFKFALSARRGCSR